MTTFMDVRMNPVGGELSTVVALNQGTSIADYTGMLCQTFLDSIQGCDVLIATHGFNVNRQDGISGLHIWHSLLQLPPSSAFVGLLWPGDSIWAHGLDYPDEPKVANLAGQLLAPFIDKNFAGASSISFASHSLGARVVLETVALMSTPVRRVILMAGAIDDNCLNTEFQNAAGKIGAISVLASRKDRVLSTLFPLGNLIAGIIAEGHPWWHAAIGHAGPSKQWPSNFGAPFMIPDVWEFDHGDYVPSNALPPNPPPPAPSLPIPTNVPPQGSPVFAPDLDPAGNPIPGWKEAFSTAFASTRFR